MTTITDEQTLAQRIGALPKVRTNNWLAARSIRPGTEMAFLAHNTGLFCGVLLTEDRNRSMATVNASILDRYGFLAPYEGARFVWVRNEHINPVDSTVPAVDYYADVPEEHRAAARAAGMRWGRSTREVDGMPIGRYLFTNDERGIYAHFWPGHPQTTSSTSRVVSPPDWFGWTFYSDSEMELEAEPPPVTEEPTPAYPLTNHDTIPSQHVAGMPEGARWGEVKGSAIVPDGRYLAVNTPFGECLAMWPGHPVWERGHNHDNHPVMAPWRGWFVRAGAFTPEAATPAVGDRVRVTACAASDGDVAVGMTGVLQTVNDANSLNGFLVRFDEGQDVDFAWGDRQFWVAAVEPAPEPTAEAAPEAAPDEPTPEPTLDLTAVPEQYRAQVPPGAAWHEATIGHMGRFLGIPDPCHGGSGAVNHLLWPGHPRWGHGHDSRQSCGVPEGWRSYRTSQTRLSAPPEPQQVEPREPQPWPTEVPEEHRAAIPEGARWATVARLYSAIGNIRTVPAGPYLAMDNRAYPGRPLLLVWPGHPHHGTGWLDRTEDGAPVGWQGFRISRDTELTCGFAYEAEPEPEEVTTLRAELAQLRSDLATIGAIMQEEAVDRDWCGEYEGVVSRIEEATCTPLPDTWKRVQMVEHHVDISFERTITGRTTLTVEAPEDADGDQINEAVAEWLRCNTPYSVDWDTEVDLTSLRIDDVEVSDYEQV